MEDFCCTKCKQEVEELWTSWMGKYLDACKELWYCEVCWEKLKNKVDRNVG